MKQKELNKILESHAHWLQREGGERANLAGADLCWAELHWANLTGANLYEADLAGADLRHANLYGADLRHANLYGADLYESNLTGAGLYEANLDRANLDRADLARANLRHAYLRQAYLTEADLTGANLTGANLTRADLRWANFMNVIGLSVICAQVNTSCENRRITYIPSIDVVTAGCFQGTFEEFEKRVEEKHKYNPFVLSRYRRVIAFLKREAEEDRTREKEMTTVGQDDGQSAQD